MNENNATTLNEQFASYYVLAMQDEDKLKAFGRFGNGLFAAFSSFKFFIMAQGHTWPLPDKETRQAYQEEWAQYRSENEASVKSVTGYHFRSVKERRRYNDNKGELTCIRTMVYDRVLSKKETADYLEMRAKIIDANRNPINGKPIADQVKAAMEEATKA